MKLFGRYIFRQVAGAFLMIMLSLTAVVWIATALKQLTLLTNQGQDAWIFMKITLLALPNLMVTIGPVALLIASLHTLNRLNGDSELIVMTASGAKIWRFATPLLILAGMVTALIVAANFYVMPWSLRALTSYIMQVRTDLISQVLQPGQFSSPEPGLTFHIRDRTASGEILGIVMEDARDAKQAMSYLAERGEIVKQADKAYLIMHNGQIVRRAAKEDGAQIIEFTRYIVDLSQIGPKQNQEVLKPRALYLHELLVPDPGNWYWQNTPGSFRAEIHERFASPLYPLVFVLIVIAFLGQARTNRTGRNKSLILAFVAAVGARLTGLAATNLVNIQAWGIVLVYGIPIGAVLLAIWTAHASTIPRRRSRLGRWLEARTDRAAAVLGGLGRRLWPAGAFKWLRLPRWRAAR